MIHKTREDRPHDKGNVFIFGDVTDETLRSLEMLLQKDGYGAAVVKKKDGTPRFTNAEPDSRILTPEDCSHHPIPQ